MILAHWGGQEAEHIPAYSSLEDYRREGSPKRKSALPKSTHALWLKGCILMNITKKQNERMCVGYTLNTVLQFLSVDYFMSERDTK